MESYVEYPRKRYRWQRRQARAAMVSDCKSQDWGVGPGKAGAGVADWEGGGAITATGTSRAGLGGSGSGHAGCWRDAPFLGCHLEPGNRNAG